MRALTEEQKALVMANLDIAASEARYAARRGIRGTRDELLAAAYLGLVDAAQSQSPRVDYRSLATIVCRRTIRREVYLLYRSHSGRRHIYYGSVSDVPLDSEHPLASIVRHEDCERLRRAISRLKPMPRIAVLAWLEGRLRRSQRGLFSRALVTLRETMSP